MPFTGQAQYRAIFENTLEAIAVVDVGGAIMSANPAVEETFGYTPRELIGCNLTLLMPGGSAPGRYARRRSDTRATSRQSRAVDGRRKDGSIFPIDLSVTEWQRDGETFFTDIMRDASISRDAATDRRKATRALRDSEERFRLLHNDFAHLARVNDLGEMAAAIAHEINQPLSAIENYLNGALMLVDTESPLEALAVARSAMILAAEQGRRAGTIVTGLRAFVRRGEGVRRLESADALVESAMAMALVDAGCAGVQVEYLEAGAGVKVEADAVQIQQVLVNLLRNAMEALGTNEARQARQLSIVTRVLPGEDAVEFCVADSGPGIAPALRGRLFEPFVTNKAMGMGMGLSICRRIVEAHDGTIAADDDQGTGAVFRMRLPSA